MNRAEAAWRLGTPIVECAECDVTALRDESLAVMRITPMDGLPTSDKIESTHYVCSAHCAVDYADGCAGYLRFFRWNQQAEQWSEIGTRRHEGDPLKWTDTGTALWIKERVARLRAQANEEFRG